MKRALKNLIILAIVGVALYAYHEQVSDYFNTAVSEIKTLTQAPCSQPIPYQLGTFAPQFGISQTDFLSAIAQAQAIWAKPFGKQFFVYSPNDTSPDVLKINLVYDYRQQATSKLAGLGITVHDDQASYDSLKTKYTALQAQYAQAQSTLVAQVQAFNAKQDTYGQEVDHWNAQGGAPHDIYEQLQAEGSALKDTSTQLQAKQAQINDMVDEINSLVVVLNRLVNVLNINVNSYNTVGTTLGESFEEGVYESGGGTQKIDIYEYTDHDKLVRVLAHELGHAIGLQHVTDPNAIMYKLNQGTNLALTQADIDELKSVCKIQQNVLLDLTKYLQ